MNPFARSSVLQPDKDGNGGGLVREAVMGRFPEDDASDAQGMASSSHQTQLELDLEVNSKYEVRAIHQKFLFFFSAKLPYVHCLYPL